jgi:hypothetical protein
MYTAYLVLDIFVMPFSGAPFSRASYCYGDCRHIAYHSGPVELVS